MAHFILLPANAERPERALNLDHILSTRWKKRPDPAEWTLEVTFALPHALRAYPHTEECTRTEGEAIMLGISEEVARRTPARAGGVLPLPATPIMDPHGRTVIVGGAGAVE